MTRLKELLFGGTSGVVLFDVLLNSADLLLAVSDTLFSLMVVVSGYLGPEIGWLDEELMTRLLIAVAVLYVINLLITIIGEITNETDS